MKSERACKFAGPTKDFGRFLMQEQDDEKYD
jgi:hypothetical protein